MLLKVISASRRIELVGCFPDQLVDLLGEKCPPEKTHTLVIWTKDPRNLLYHPRLNRKVLEYEQIYIHYTITGMGSSFIERKVPPKEESLKVIPKVIQLLGDPRRLRIRFDPIVHLRLPDGRFYTNLGHFRGIAEVGAQLGVKDISISWMEHYPKVVRRLRKAGIEPLKPNASQQQKEADYIYRVATELGLTVHACCVPGLPRSRCIDGELLSKLHPRGLKCSTKRAKAQRDLCGCTESWDIGWYNPCPNGCLYCYANPVEWPDPIQGWESNLPI